jgi:DNA-binding NarL/FixJ family response regulator
MTRRPPRDDEPRAFTFRVGREDLFVLSVPADPSEVPPSLSPAELAVAHAVARGASNEAIARERGTSVRTVANQVASVLRKLRVSTRVEIAARLSQLTQRRA